MRCTPNHTLVSLVLLGEFLTLILNLYLAVGLKASEEYVAWVNGLLPGRPRLVGHLVFHFSFRLPFSFLPLIHFDDDPLIGVSLAVLAGNDRWHFE